MASQIEDKKSQLEAATSRAFLSNFKSKLPKSSDGEWTKASGISTSFEISVRHWGTWISNEAVEDDDNQVLSEESLTLANKVFADYMKTCPFKDKVASYYVSESEKCWLEFVINLKEQAENPQFAEVLAEQSEIIESEIQAEVPVNEAPVQVDAIPEVQIPNEVIPVTGALKGIEFTPELPKATVAELKLNIIPSKPNAMKPIVPVAKVPKVENKHYEPMCCAIINAEGKLEYVTKLGPKMEILETTPNFLDEKCHPPSEKVSTAIWFAGIRKANLHLYPRILCFKQWENVKLNMV